jgi:hypothetical protein
MSAAVEDVVQAPVREDTAEAWRMRRLIFGHIRSRAVCAMAELGLADRIGSGCATHAELTAATGADPDLLTRLLRSLVAFGVLRQDDETGGYALTGLGATLRSGAMGSALPTALLASAVTGLAWDAIPQAVRSGQPGCPQVHGADFFDVLDRNPSLRALFDRSQEAGLELELDGIVGALDLTGVGSVVDVGGGDGALLCALLSARPALRGTVLDQEAVVPAARRRLSAAGLGHRGQARTGDFFSHVPSADLLVLRHILHDWSDTSCLDLLRVCRRALAPGGRIVLVEQLVGSGTAAEAEYAALMDLYMMSLFDGGRERDLAAFGTLLHGAGFVLGRVQSIGGGCAVIEARPDGEVERTW